MGREGDEPTLDPQDQIRRRRGLILAVLALFGLSMGVLAFDAHGEPAAAPLALDESPALAVDGTNYLVVWTDYGSGTGDIYAARVNADGLVLDPGPGIPVSTAPAQQVLPAVAFDGTNYLVVWQDRRTDDVYDIYGARVTPAGVVLDAGGIPIATAAGEQTAADVAFDGTNYLVTWTDGSGSSGPEVYGARVTTAGTLLDPDGILISIAGSSQSSADVAFDGTNYLVSWMDRRIGVWNIYGTRVTPQGAVLDPDGIPISTAPDYQIYPALAFGQDNTLVVWADKRGGVDYNIHGARVTPAGNVLEPGGIPISTAAEQDVPAVAFGGSNYLA